MVCTCTLFGYIWPSGCRKILKVHRWTDNRADKQRAGKAPVNLWFRRAKTIIVKKYIYVFFLLLLIDGNLYFNKY